MGFKLILTMILFSSIGFSATKRCRVDTFKKVLFLKQPTQLKHLDNIIKSSSCSQETLWEVGRTLYQIDGSISSKHLNRFLKEEGINEQVALWPDQVEVIKLSRLVNLKLPLEETLHAKEFSIIDPIYSLGLENLRGIQASCHACNTTGTKNASFTFTNPISGYERKLWIKLEIMQATRVAVAKSDIRPFAKTSLENEIEFKQGYYEDTSLYVKNMDEVKYYRINKAIKKGSPIKYSDLSPKTLVELGKLTEVLIEGRGLKIKSEAIARQSGKFGEQINLYNPESRKKLRGKVIDYNKVKVEI